VIDSNSRRFILAWELKSDMTSNSLIDVVHKAVDATGTTDVPVEDRTMLLSDNGPGYLSRQFGEYLRLAGFTHRHKSRGDKYTCCAGIIIVIFMPDELNIL